MIKRPLNSRFSDAVLEGRKVTTIRDTPWPVGKPIMLYNWSGAAYRSPQIDVAAVLVVETTLIRIGTANYRNARSLWQSSCPATAQWEII